MIALLEVTEGPVIQQLKSKVGLKKKSIYIELLLIWRIFTYQRHMKWNIQLMLFVEATIQWAEV